MKRQFLTTTLSFFMAIYSIAQENSASTFSQLDKNKDGVLTQEEIPNLNYDCFLFGDRDFNGTLSEKDYKGYLHYQKRIADERKLMPEGTRQILDIPYVENGHIRQKLDIYLPKEKTDKPLPLIIYVHGGGWHRGSKQLIGEKCALLNDGFAMASINYRLTDEGPFPIQIHDCKAAVRYLRANAEKYGFDADNFGVWGGSAGGHLVALLGTTGDDPKLEGELGILGVSSKVQAVCDWYGPTDFIEMFRRRKTKGTEREGAWTTRSPMSKLFGGLISDNEELARLASPVNHVTSDDAPHLIMHGPTDPLVPLSQGASLFELLRVAKVDCEFVIEEVPGHGFPHSSERTQRISKFFQKYLQ